MNLNIQKYDEYFTVSGKETFKIKEYLKMQFNAKWDNNTRAWRMDNSYLTEVEQYIIDIKTKQLKKQDERSVNDQKHFDLFMRIAGNWSNASDDDKIQLFKLYPLMSSILKSKENDILNKSKTLKIYIKRSIKNPNAFMITTNNVLYVESIIANDNIDFRYRKYDNNLYFKRNYLETAKLLVNKLK